MIKKSFRRMNVDSYIRLVWSTLIKKKEPGIEIVIHGFSNFEAIIYGTFLYQIIVHGFNHI